MCKNFLENMYKIFVLIRFDIKNKNNVELLELLSTGINKDTDNAEMMDSVLEIIPEFKQQLVLQNGEPFGLNGGVKEFMLSALHIARKGLEEKEYELAYDVIDMLHVFPRIVMTDDVRQVKEYWKVYVNPVIEKRNLKKILSKVKKCRT